MRKELNAISLSILIVGSAAFSGGCDNKTPPNPGIILSFSSESPKMQWDNLSAKERLTGLLIKNYPLFSDFNRQTETTLATMQVYCEQTNYPFAKNLVNSVYYANEDEFTTVDFKNTGIFLTKDQIQSKIATTTSEGKIYINEAQMNQQINEPDIIKLSGDRDPRIVCEISVLVHEFLHKFPKIQLLTFKGFYDKSSASSNRVWIDTLNGFTIQGKNSKGEPVYLTEGNEAILDCAARIIVEEKMRLPYVSPPKNAKNSTLIKELNDAAGISNEIFLKYVIGDYQQAELLKQWGAYASGTSDAESNLKIGILALIFKLYK